MGSHDLECTETLEEGEVRTPPPKRPRILPFAMTTRDNVPCAMLRYLTRQEWLEGVAALRSGLKMEAYMPLLYAKWKELDRLFKIPANHLHSRDNNYHCDRPECRICEEIPAVMSAHCMRCTTGSPSGRNRRLSEAKESGTGLDCIFCDECVTEMLHNELCSFCLGIIEENVCQGNVKIAMLRM